MQKRALAVHDISCVGRCSLTVALPIISAAGINTAALPTALLSTHTGEFSGYTHLDLSDQLLPIATHLKTLGLHYDAFYSGYLASSAQVEQVLQIIDLLCNEKTHIFVDPAFADHGKLYSLMGQDMPDQMRRLCGKAHTIVPNLTEAAFLLGQPYPKAGYSAAHIADFAQALSGLGPDHIVITDIAFDDKQTGIAVYQKGMAEPFFLFEPRFEGIFHGTGDVFASFLLSALMRDQSLLSAAKLALSLTHESIRLTLAEQQPLRYGVQFERCLPKLLEMLNDEYETES